MKLNKYITYIVSILCIILLTTLLTFSYIQNVNLRKDIEQKDRQIEELSIEINRYKMISEEFENLFINCTEGE